MENKLEFLGIILWLITSPLLVMYNVSHNQLLNITSVLYVATFFIAVYLLISKIRKLRKSMKNTSKSLWEKIKILYYIILIPLWALTLVLDMMSTEPLWWKIIRLIIATIVFVLLLVLVPEMLKMPVLPQKINIPNQDQGVIQQKIDKNQIGNQESETLL